jgi:hypothetical protein
MIAFLTERARPLTSPFFLFALFLLLANDLFFKGLFHNALTGKLSDFAGLFVFSLFWTSLLPAYKRTVLVLTGLLFIVWKSSWSQGLIDSWNALPLFDIGRVVDRSDLMALSVLPLAHFHERILAWSGRSRLAPSVPLLLSAFAFMATSYRSEVEHRKDHDFPYSEDSLLKRLHEEALYMHAPRIWEKRPGDTVEHVYVHRFTGDSMSAERYGHLEERLGDTIAIGVPDTGLGRFTVELGVGPRGKGSRLRTYSIRFEAPNKEKYKERLPKVFEERLIRELRSSDSREGSHR